MKVKALIPAAGRGKRLAHLSGGRPKELIEVGPWSMIEHCLAMVLDSGVKDVGLVIRPGKEEIRERLERLSAGHPSGPARLVFIHQDPPRGVAEAMLLAADFAGDDPLAVIMPDNLLLGGKPALAQMLAGFRQVSQPTTGLILLGGEKARLFGNVGRVDLEAPVSPVRPVRVKSLSPKGLGHLAVKSPEPFYKGFQGTIYTPDWVEIARHLKPNLEGELDDTDIVLELVRQGRLWAVLLEGQGFDLGNPEGLAAARNAWARFYGAPGHEN